MSSHKSRYALLAAVACVALGAASPAQANAIISGFNINASGAFAANTTDVTTATTITSGAPNDVAAILPSDNTGVVAGQAVTLTSPTPLTVGSSFSVSFTTATGTFTDALTVATLTQSANAASVTAFGTITETACGSTCLTPSASVYSSSYTQNGGPGTQINGSFNISTSAVPGPIVGAGLPGLLLACGSLIAFARRRRQLAV